MTSAHGMLGEWCVWGANVFVKCVPPLPKKKFRCHRKLRSRAAFWSKKE